MGSRAHVENSVSPNLQSTVTHDVASLHARAKRAEKLAGHQALLVAMLAELLASGSLQAALDALAGALKARFDCDRVAIALVDHNDLILHAVSQQAVIEPSSSEVRLLVDTMREACAEESVVCWPQSSDTLGVLAAHRALAGRRLSDSICTVPLYVKHELVGAFLLERRDQRAYPVSTLERLSVCLAPLLMLHKRADRGWWTVLGTSLHLLLERYLGRERPGLRLLCALAMVTAVCMFTVPIRWQIVAPADLFSYERRLVTAPQAGFVSELQVAAGDRVTKGQVVAELDRRELELEATSRDSDVIMADAEFRAAISSYDHQATGIARARLAQARARRAGVQQLLNRTKLVSPIDGVVIAADASRSIGTAVSRGETLFEVAPGTDFDVHVLVDEADVYDVFVGQVGMLSLRAKPGDTLPIVVESIHPVAEAKDGKNRFRVRANLSEPEAGLLPGQSGVVRLDAGRLSVMGVLSRPLKRRLAELWWRLVG